MATLQTHYCRLFRGRILSRTTSSILGIGSPTFGISLNSPTTTPATPASLSAIDMWVNPLLAEVGGAGAVEGDKARALVDGDVEEGYVAVAHQDLGIVPDLVIVEEW